MILKKWEQLPDNMRIQQVEAYYTILRKKRAGLIAKRLFDIVVSLLMILLLSPLMLVIAIWIKCDS